MLKRRGDKDETESARRADKLPADHDAGVAVWRRRSDAVAARDDDTSGGLCTKTGTLSVQPCSEDLRPAATSARTPLPAINVSAVNAPIAPIVHITARPKVVNSTDATVASRNARRKE
jgi:hypothetical protein